MANKLDVKKLNINTEEIKGFVANFIIPLVALLLIVVLFLAIIRPALADKPVLEAELAEKEILSQTLEEKYAKLNNLLDFQQSVEENATLLDEVLVSEPLVPQLLTQIDQIASESGLEVTRLSYSLADATTATATPDATASAPTDGGKDVIATLGVNGTYGQIVTFLDTIENAGRVVIVDNLRFTINEEDDTLYAASFTLSSPYVELNTMAVTDDPITFDIADTSFQSLMEQLKQLRIYRISIDEVIDITDLEVVDEGGAPVDAAAPEEIAETIEQITGEPVVPTAQ